MICKANLADFTLLKNYNTSFLHNGLFHYTIGLFHHLTFALTLHSSAPLFKVADCPWQPRCWYQLVQTLYHPPRSRWYHLQCSTLETKSSFDLWPYLVRLAFICSTALGGRLPLTTGMLKPACSNTLPSSRIQVISPPVQCSTLETISSFDLWPYLAFICSTALGGRFPLTTEMLTPALSNTLPSSRIQVIPPPP